MARPQTHLLIPTSSRCQYDCLLHHRLMNWVNSCNLLLHKEPNASLQKIQCVQNNFACAVCELNKLKQPLEESEDPLWEIHWLPIERLIKFTLATLSYKVTYKQQPAYIASPLSEHKPSCWGMCSSNKGLLNKPRSQTSITARRFASAAPYIWNNLPSYARFTDT